MLVGEKLPAEAPSPSAPIAVTPSASTESQRAQLSSPSESTIVVPLASANADSAVVERPYSRKLFYQLNIPILIIDLLIIGFGCYIEVAKISVEHHFGFVGFECLLAAACVSFLYTAVLAGITFWGPHLPIPVLARILVNSLIVIPLWICALILFAIFEVEVMPLAAKYGPCKKWQMIAHNPIIEPGEPIPNDEPIAYEETICWAIIKNMRILGWIGFGFGTFATVLTVIDFCYAVSLNREMRAKKRRLTSNPNHEPSYPNKLFYSLHIPIAILIAAGMIGSSWVASYNVQSEMLLKEDLTASAIMLSALTLSLIWSCTLIGLQADHIHVPVLARILINSICIIPFLWVSAGIQISVVATTRGRQACMFRLSEEGKVECDNRWPRVDIASGSSSGLALFASILYLVDLVYSIRLHGKILRKRRMALAAGPQPPNMNGTSESP